MPKHRPAPTIAAVMIAKDEARCIARCLDSVRPFVDRMLVLDTGSTDATPGLAAAAGAEVHHLPWPNDFAAARNHALALADADWNLSIDADEWITAGGALLRKWCQKPVRLGTVCVHSEEASAAGGAPGTGRRNWMPRLLPRGVHYAGRVHEQPVSRLPHQRIELHLAHDGYVGAQVLRKQDRNRPLLLAELQDRPGDPYLLFQLGKDAEQQGDLAQACGHYAAAYPNVPANVSYRHALVLRHVNALRKTGRGELAFAVADREMANWPDSPDFFFLLGHLAFERAQAEPAHAAGNWLPLAAAAWERCLAIGERPDLESSMQGCGSHLAANNLAVVQRQLAALGA
jgi:glycosyltransferase involved in cell wall biosynthesis